MDEDERVFENAFHAIRIRYEIGREVATIELHTFDNVKGGLNRLGFFNGNDAVFADLVHRFGNDVADGGVVVRGHGRHLRDHRALLDFLCQVLDFGCDGFDSFINTALHSHRVYAGGHSLHAFTENGLRENSCGGGAVAGNVAGLRCDFLHHLRAHVFQGILEFDFLRDGHAVFCDLGGAEFLVENHVAALGTERDLDGVRQQIHPAQNDLAGLFTVYDLFCCH